MKIKSYEKFFHIARVRISIVQIDFVLLEVEKFQLEVKEFNPISLWIVTKYHMNSSIHIQFYKFQ